MIRCSRALAAALAIVLSACGSAAGGGHAPAPSAIVLLVPGSGFRGADSYDVADLSITSAMWRRWGFLTRAAPYGPGKAGPDDVAAAIRHAHAAHPGLPLCLYGESSGGTWALVAAAREPGVACVVISASPTDEETWRHSKRPVAHTFSHRVWPAYFGSATADDGYEPLDVWKQSKPAVRAFLIVARNDPVVPPQQGQIFARAVPGSTLRILSKGNRQFVHSRVSRPGFARVAEEVRRFAQAAVR
jgi:pimeloyl-ACP methyl ester carboxylesterase